MRGHAPTGNCASGFEVLMSATAAASFIPNPFGGFAPFPNAMMIPFMGAQSAVLAYQFGINYEFGKRTIRAMSNPEFNALVTTPEGRAGLAGAIHEQALETLTQFRNLIPDFQSLQNDIIEQSVVIEVKKAERTPSAFVEIMQAFSGASATEVGQKLDGLTEAERGFILSVNPMLAVIYSIYKLGLDAINLPPAPPDEPIPPDFELPETITTFEQNIVFETCTAGVFDSAIASYTETLEGHLAQLDLLKTNVTTNCNDNLVEATVPKYINFILVTYNIVVPPLVLVL